MKTERAFRNSNFSTIRNRFSLALVLLFTVHSYAGPTASERSREVVKLVPAGINSICRDLGIEAQEPSGKWFCLTLEFVSKPDQLSTLQVLQSSLDVAQKNDPASMYLYRVNGSLHHGFHVKSVKLIKTPKKA